MAAPGPILRLFGSLANTLLDLGLPRIRAWVKERLGPDADVASVSTEGSLIHLDGVRLPIGPRGLLVLRRATAAITAARGTGKATPEIRLHAFEGVLSFGTPADDRFEADVVFVGASDPDAAAWIAGELSIPRATWTARAARVDSPSHAPLSGRARLVVTSSTWRLDDGSLVSEHADVRFEGGGATDASDAGGALANAALELTGARVGPFVDAIGAMVGRVFEVPSAVPLDARLTGALAFDAASGGTCKLHVTADGLGLDVNGSVGASGSALDATVKGEVSAAVLVRRAGLPAACLPRDEDRFVVSAHATGDTKAPHVVATIGASEVGFRLGRPRFQPAMVVRAVEVHVEAHGKDATVRASARVGKAAIEATGSLDRIELRAKDIEASWIVAVANAAGTGWLCEGEPPPGRFAIPRATSASAELAIVPRGADAGVRGTVTAVTPSSNLVLHDLAIHAGGDTHEIAGYLRGTLAAADALAIGLFPFDVRPTEEGSATLDLALTGVVGDLAAAGHITTPRLAIAIRSRLDVPPFVLHDVTTALAVGRTELRYSEGRFRAYGGSFRAEGIVPFEGEGSAPRLVVHGRDADASLAEAVGRLARGRLKVRVERSGPRPAEEVWIPRTATIAGELTLAADGSTTGEIALETAAQPDGSSSVLLSSLRLSAAPALRLDGSTLRGTLAIADALVAGAFDTALRPLPEGAARIDATMRGQIEDVVLSGFVTVPKVRLALAGDSPAIRNGPIVFATDVTTLFRIDTSKIVWQRCEGQLYGGRLESSGVIGYGASFVGLQSTIALRDVSLGHVPRDRSGRPLAESAFGRLNLDMRFDRKGETGPVLGRGFARLDEAAFPALHRTGPSLARYGLEPPDPRAIAPATVEIALGEPGWAFTNAFAAVPHMEARGDIRLGFDGNAEGAFVVTLGEAFLGASPLFVLPSILADRLTMPARIDGPVARPRVHADLGACFSRFMSENRLSTFVGEAASEVASLFTGKRPAAPAPQPPWPPAAHRPPPAAPVDEDAIMRELVAMGVDWDEIEERLEDHRRGGVRYRIE